MSAWSLLFIPVSLAALSLLLYATAWLEQSVLSSRSIVLHSLRVSNADPEHIENLVANQYRRLLENDAGRRGHTPAADNGAPSPDETSAVTAGSGTVIVPAANETAEAD